MNKLVAVPAKAAEPLQAEPANEPTGLACLAIIARVHGLSLTVSQLIHDNVLPNREVTVAELLKCAKSAGLNAKLVRLHWNGLDRLKRILPAIVRLKNGRSMIMTRVQPWDDPPRVALQDPNAGEDAPLVIDRERFEAVWTGEVILVKRDYEIADETQPFTWSLISALIFRERWIVRDTAICALILGFLALTPVVFLRLMLDRVIYYKAFNTFWVLCLLLAVVLLFQAVFMYVRQYLVVMLTERIDIKLATYIFDKILNLPIDFFERTQVGRIVHDVHLLQKIRLFLVTQMFGTLLDSTVLIFFLPVMFFFSGIMTLWVLGMAGLIFLWLYALLPRYRIKTKAVANAETQRSAFLVQCMHGIRTVKSLALDARQRQQWDVHTAMVAKARESQMRTAGFIYSVVLPMEELIVSGALAIGVYLVISQSSSFTPGAIFAFLILGRRAVSPLVSMAKLIETWDDARIAVEIIGNLVNRPAEEGRSAHGVRTQLAGHVHFSNVTFKYAGAPSPALTEVTFEVPIGSTLGIMGRSGSGKTTVTRLLQRLHSDYDGLIKIDGVDIREYDVDHLRRSLGVVLQENFLFSGSIRENISAGKPDATYDEVVRAARMAGAEEFIERMPRGYETFVYEGSPNLSGGQRQRLAIARALIVDPRILILDEATSALDAESEAIVNANINRIAHGRTMIIISHRLSSLVTADAILVLERGRVVDLGKHHELLSRCDIYSDLWQTQTRHMSGSTDPRDKPPFRSPTRVS
jgi:ATP-binding cassette subfamily B protein